MDGSSGGEGVRSRTPVPERESAQRTAGRWGLGGVFTKNLRQHLSFLFVPKWLLSIEGFEMVCSSAPSCSIPLRIVQLRQALRRRLEQLRELLSHQVETLPLGDEVWMQTERELVAAEEAMRQLTDRHR